MAVTAFPVVLVNSATGSDTAASGAGPATALTGTAAVSTGTTVVLDAGTDLSGVATDGSHVLYFADATAGNRNFTAINGSSGSGGATPTVTVEQTLASTTKAWAIGGKRASVFSGTSVKLFENNGGSGDAMPGWIVEMQSAHSESISAAANLRRAGTTAGRITLRGTSGAGTLPKIILSGNSGTLVIRDVLHTLQDFELQSQTAAATTAISDAAGSNIIQGIKLSRTASNTFVTGVSCLAGNKVISCEVTRCSTAGIVVGDTNLVQNCWVHDCSGIGLSLGTSSLGVRIIGNIVANSGGDGINSGFTGNSNRSLVIIGNTVDSNTGDGLEISGTLDVGFGNIIILNNIFSNNGGYGLKMSAAGHTSVALLADGFSVLGNDTYLNTSGAYFDASGAYSNSACPWASGDPGLNPTYTSAAGGDYSIGTNLAAQGFPLGGTLHIGTGSSTYSYIDIGAAQRQATSGGGGGSVLGSSVITARGPGGR